MNRKILNIRPVLLAFTAVIIVGCAAQSTIPESTSTASGRVEDLQIIDCLLPGTVRKLGQSLTFLSPRRPTRTTGSDCEIRGGEYVSYDRANYATALKIWLPQAQEGDPAAQTYVGEIYEKGLGIQPDYPIAVAWYTKAAEQGYSRAQINLGYLYESGLGVPRDLTAAMNWYRKASGLAEGNLEYVSSVQVSQRVAVANQARELQGEVSALRGELGRLKKELGRRKNALGVRQRETQALREQLSTLKQAAATTPASPAVTRATTPGEVAALQGKLDTADAEREQLVGKLAAEQVAAADLRQQLQDADDTLNRERDRLASLQQELGMQQAQLRISESASIGRDQADAENLRLRARVISLESMIGEKQKSLAVLERSNVGKQQSLQQKIGNADRRETDLQAQINERDHELVTLRLQLSQRDEAMSGMQGELASIQQERQHLEQSLQASTGEAEKLRGSLDSAEQQLADRRMELAERKNEVDLLRGELEQQKGTVSVSSASEVRTSELETRLANLGGSLQKQIKEMIEAERTFSKQKATLSSELARMNRKAHQRQLALNTSNQAMESLNAQLQMVEMQSIASSKEIEALEAKLRAKESEIVVQKQEIGSMQAKISADAATTSTPIPQLALVESVTIGPSIEIIEPPVTLTRGMPTVRLRSAVKTIEIIGQISPAGELLSLNMNDKPQKSNASGLFQATIAVQNQETPVRVVAIDKQGHRAALDFVIRPHAAEKQQPSGGSSRPVRDGSVDLGTYHALVIGNDNYKGLVNLRTARNDARTIAGILKDKYGFKTTLLLDADRYTMYSALEKLRKELTESDNLLVYYAGHGELDRVNQRGYWLPVDAESDSTANWIPNVAITDIINVMAAKHILVVADSCYSGTLTRSSVARLETGMTSNAKNAWYKAMTKARTRIVLSSGGVQPVADSGGGEHSVFAKAFIDVLQSSGGILEGYNLYRQVQTRVKNNPIAAQLEQNPQYSPIKYAGHEAGEFLFPLVGGSVRLQQDMGALALAVVSSH